MKSKLLLIIFALNLLLTPAAFAKDEQKLNLFRIEYPEKSWSLTVNLPDYEREFVSNDSFFAINENGMTVSMFISKVDAKNDAKACRDGVWKVLQESPFEMTKTRNWKYNDMEFKSYMVDTFEDVAINQKNIIGCLAENNIWVTIHISKTDYSSRNLTLFTEVLKNISTGVLTDETKDELMEKSNIDELSDSESLGYFALGGSNFYQGELNKAIENYEKALELEKKNRTFGEAEWIVLIDNLGMAYGMSKDYENAIKTFEYGLENYPEYPMFYYNLACAYAEQNELVNTLLNLRKAYTFRENMLPGEILPNPLEDPSFANVMGEPSFQRLAKRINSRR